MSRKKTKKQQTISTYDVDSETLVIVNDDNKAFCFSSFAEAREVYKDRIAFLNLNSYEAEAASVRKVNAVVSDKAKEKIKNIGINKYYTGYTDTFKTHDIKVISY